MSGKTAVDFNEARISSHVFMKAMVDFEKERKLLTRWLKECRKTQHNYLEKRKQLLKYVNIYIYLEGI